MLPLQPREDQVKWLKNGKPKERIAIYLDTMFMLWDDGSIKAVTLSSLDEKSVELLKFAVEKHQVKVSLVDSPNATKILRPLIANETQKMQETLRFLTKDAVLEMNMQVCHVDSTTFWYLLNKLSQR
jgi:hypothetical protein